VAALSPFEDRIVRLLTLYRFPPVALGVRGVIVWASFAGSAQTITVQTGKGPGITDATIASALIALAAERGIQPCRP
jgi:hypothetical protein